MSYLLRAEVKGAGQLVLKTKNSAGDDVLLALDENVKSLNAFNWEVVVGLAASFKLVNHHFTNDYVLSTTNGTVSRAGDIITYTPSTLGSGGFWVDGSFHSVTVVADRVGKPSLTFPAEGSQSVISTPTLTGTTMSVQNPLFTHYWSRWQIATDAAFINLIFDKTSSSELLSIRIPQLTSGQTYYARVMHFGQKP